MTAENRPIFVVGTPRAGTTLVSKILSRHPAVHAAGETHFFEEIWAKRTELGPLANQAEIETAVNRLMTVFGRFNQTRGQALVDKQITPDTLTTLALAYGGGYAGLYQAFTDSLREDEHSSRYCDDTPRHLFHLETIFQHFPNAAVIICLRDPRDFLCSYKNFWRTSRTPGRIKALYHPLITALLWRSSANVILNHPTANQPDKVFWLRYESLVADPRKVIQEICRHVGLTYDDSLLEIQSHNSSFDQSQTDGIFQGSVGQWAGCLTQEEIWWAQRLNQKQMARLAYEAAEVNPSWRGIMRLFLSTPLALYKALQANSGRRGPLGPYLRRRLTHLTK